MGTDSDHLTPVHPGEILQEEFLRPMGLGPIHLAQAAAIPPETLWPILKGKTPVTAEIALRLARVFSTTPEFWLNLQTAFDLQCAAHTAKLDDVRALITHPA